MTNLMKILQVTMFLFSIFSIHSAAAVSIKGNPKAISIMAYNVENLFDTKQDADREDYTYLPLSFKKGNKAHYQACQLMETDFYIKECLELDWNDDVLAVKLNRLRDTILQIGGVGPDILILEEVENIDVLELLANSMPEAQYTTRVLIEGDDRRGIDVGVLSRLPLFGEPKLNRIKFTPNPKDPQWTAPLTRGILQVPLRLPNGQRLTVMGFHWPSQRNPVQERIDAVNTLNGLMEKLGPQELVVAAGDSNITLQEDLKYGLQSRLLASHWEVSHLVGCTQCSGTHSYQGEWSFLDVMLFSPALNSAGKGFYKLLPDSIRIPKDGKYQLKADGTPARFNEKSKIGVSDHLPLYGEILGR